MAENIFARPEFSPMSLVAFAQAVDPRVVTNLTMRTEAAFPVRNIATLDISYLKRSSPGVKLASVMALSGVPVPVSTPGMTLVRGEIPAAKITQVISGDMLTRLFSPASESMLQSYIQEEYLSLAKLIGGVYATAELMRVQLMSAGGIITAADSTGASVVVDFGQAAALHPSALSTTARWSEHATATPISDIQAWMDVVVGVCGIMPNRMYMSRTTMLHMLQCESVRNQLFPIVSPTVSSNYVVGRLQVEAFFTQLGTPLTIETYDDTVLVEGASGTVTSTRLFPLNKISLFNDTVPIGETLYGISLEELMAQADSGANTGLIESSQNGRVYAAFQKTEDMTYKRGAYAAVIPSAPNIDTVFCIQVHD